MNKTSINQFVTQALQHGVRATTTLQEAVKKVRKARRQNDELFNIALGELFVFASDAFKERNGLRNKVKELQDQNKRLKEVIERLRHNQSGD